MVIKYNGYIESTGTTVFVTNNEGYPRSIAEELAKLLPDNKGYCEMTIEINVQEGESCMRVCKE